MDAYVGFYHVKPGTPVDRVATARDALSARLRDLPGLQQGATVVTGPDSLISLSCWGTRAQAEQAAAVLSDWAREDLGTAAAVEGHVGAFVLLHISASAHRRPTFAVVLTHTPKPGTPGLEDRMRAEFIPVFEQQPGFNAFTRMRADDGTLITLVEWDSREALAKAQPSLSRWGDENVTPHMSGASSRPGEVVWSYRRR